MSSRFLSLHAQHVDEYVFEAWLDFVPDKGASLARVDGYFERRAVRPCNTQSAPEHGSRLDSGRAAQMLRRRVKIFAPRLEDYECWMSGDVVRPTLYDDPPVSKIDD